MNLTAQLAHELKFAIVGWSLISMDAMQRNKSIEMQIRSRTGMKLGEMRAWEKNFEDSNSLSCAQRLGNIDQGEDLSTDLL